MTKSIYSTWKMFVISKFKNVFFFFNFNDLLKLKIKLMMAYTMLSILFLSSWLFERLFIIFFPILRLYFPIHSFHLHLPRNTYFSIIFTLSIIVVHSWYTKQEQMNFSSWSSIKIQKKNCLLYIFCHSTNRTWHTTWHSLKPTHELCKYLFLQIYVTLSYSLSFGTEDEHQQEAKMLELKMSYCRCGLVGRFVEVNDEKYVLVCM